MRRCASAEGRSADTTSETCCKAGAPQLAAPLTAAGPVVYLQPVPRPRRTRLTVGDDRTPESSKAGRENSLERRSLHRFPPCFSGHDRLSTFLHPRAGSGQGGRKTRTGPKRTRVSVRVLPVEPVPVQSALVWWERTNARLDTDPNAASKNLSSGAAASGGSGKLDAALASLISARY